MSIEGRGSNIESQILMDIVFGAQETIDSEFVGNLLVVQPICGQILI
jgi:hypothetical protein